MTNLERDSFACDEDLFTEGVIFDETRLTDRTGVAHACPIIKTVLDKYKFSSV